MQRNVTDDPPAEPGNPCNDKPPRRQEGGNVGVQHERIPIDVVNHSGELDTPLEITVLTDPYLDRVMNRDVAHRTSIPRRHARRRAEPSGRLDTSPHLAH